VAAQGDQEGAAALKEIFNARRIRYIAAEVAAVYPAFDSERFVRANLRGLETLSLIKRLRRVAETLHAAIPQDYRKSLGILRGPDDRSQADLAV
jgi:3-methyladenine DNA glycosylase AlkC